jgi:hypothetical protein
MNNLLVYNIKDQRSTKVKEHLARAALIAEVFYRHFQIGPYQIRFKHLRWFLEVDIEPLSSASECRHWLTLGSIVKALKKWDQWPLLLYGSWVKPLV